MKTLLTVTFIFTFIFCSSQNSKTTEDLPNHIFTKVTNSWVYLDESVTKIKYYIKNIEPENNYSKDYLCWVKTVNPPKSYKNKKGIWISKQSDYSLERWRVNCSSKRYSILSYVSYNSKGEVISSDKLSGEINDVIPETMSEAVFEYVCSTP